LNAIREARTGTSLSKGRIAGKSPGCNFRHGGQCLRIIDSPLSQSSRQRIAARLSFAADQPANPPHRRVLKNSTDSATSLKDVHQVIAPDVGQLMKQIKRTCSFGREVINDTAGK